jgi:hypothetical protein
MDDHARYDAGGSSTDWLESACARPGIGGHDTVLQQFETGQGDYTAERHTWLGNRTVRELGEEIERQRKAVVA